MSATEPSQFHQCLRQAVKAPHHVLDHHPILTALLADDVSLVGYGNALAALHGIYAQTEFEILRFLEAHPGVFEYAPLRKLPALEADLIALQRLPVPVRTPAPRIASLGNLFGTLYTIEGATLGGQFIAQKLRKVHPAALPLRFYSVYGENVRQRWAHFLEKAQTRCPPSEYAAAVAAATALFESIRMHLDESGLYYASAR